MRVRDGMPTTARSIVNAPCRMQSLSVMGGDEGGGAGWPTMRFASAYPLQYYLDCTKRAVPWVFGTNTQQPELGRPLFTARG